MNMIPSVRATEPGRAQLVNPRPRLGIVVYRTITSDLGRVTPLEKGIREGESPVCHGHRSRTV